MNLDRVLDSFYGSSTDELMETLNAFNSQWAQVFSVSEPVAKKKKLVENIFRYLRDPEHEKHYLTLLTTLRILSRDKNGPDELFTIDRVETILHFARLVGEEEAFMTDNSEHFDARIVIEAQKSICNLIFNNLIIRRICCNNSFVDGIMLRLKMFKDPQLPFEVKYYDMRALFLITALSPEMRPKIREKYHGLIYLMEAVDLILKEAEEPGQKPSKKSQRKRNKDKSKTVSGETKSQSEKTVPSTQLNEKKDAKGPHSLDSSSVDLCCEVLKVLYNLTLSYDRGHLDEVEEAHFLRLVGILHDLLLTEAETKEKKEELHNHIVNMLTNIPSYCYEELLVPIEEIGRIDNPRYEYEDMNVEAISVLLEFLERRFDKPSKELYESLSPVLTCLSSMARTNRIIRKYLKNQILPPLRDVENRPEEGDTSRNKLVRLMTNPDTRVKEMAADFLFVLCKESAQRLVKYTGYGNAAGLLAKRGLMLGGRGKGNYSSESEDSDTEEYLKVKEKINPVTGCYEPKKTNPMEGMSDAEKEAEAIKLINMMDKLLRTGTIQPCRVGEDGKPHPVEHILELQYPERDILATEKESADDSD
ncbi:synembryn-A-like [Panonychus citri]|uniref:synembryn-A-like n=1 Tax=Panonychus citri TaxID=50023 RepID=UPI002307BC94|nr:synembryn-A-like [Panonychus citri]XP_053214631.1 synembryn-A-like [Panonychus citri]